MMKDVIIYGAGSVGRLSEQIILDINQETKQFNLLGFLDDNPEKHGTTINQTPILGGIDWLRKNPNVFIALGFSNPTQKFDLINRLKDVNHTKYASLVHPASWISNRVKIGHGTVIYPGVHIDVDVTIGEFCLMNKLCTIGHDSVLGPYSTISPSVNIGGFNRIGKGVEFGINSCSIQKINIGNYATIGAGSVIIRDVEDYAVVAGNPGRLIRKNEK